MQDFVLQLEIIKRNIKSSQSKEEAESLKFSQKHIINKVLIKVSEDQIL